MNRLQRVLLFALVLLAALVATRAALDRLAAVVVGALAAVAAAPSVLAAVPAWVWWTLFGVSMSLICPMKVTGSRRCGRGTSCGAWRS